MYSNVSVPPKQRRIKRQGADKTKHNIDDIYKVLDETDPDALPIFVARDLGKQPTIDFNLKRNNPREVPVSLRSQFIHLCKTRWVAHHDAREVCGDL